ncbi:Hypothetical predicted protein [Mytilus galloprovincialis]|uniref:HTH psq-type domain-containing protein n=1 Tax=Mytilus galloprovincialis TaxID=29158 RepID=A0A8B6CPN3_MYTGA|nr:Hypothetical predicted protein [Mytilus galloprovincialis]
MISFEVNNSTCDPYISRPRRQRHDSGRHFDSNGPTERHLDIRGVLEILRKNENYTGGVNCAINPVHQPGGKAKYRTYSPTSLINAYTAVKEDNVSIRRASITYGVPFQTLRDRITGIVDPECCTMGNGPFFTLDEESRLVSHLKEMAQLGYGYNRQEVVDIATDYAVMLDKKK